MAAPPSDTTFGIPTRSLRRGFPVGRRQAQCVGALSAGLFGREFGKPAAASSASKRRISAKPSFLPLMHALLLAAVLRRHVLLDLGDRLGPTVGSDRARQFGRRCCRRWLSTGRREHVRAQSPRRRLWMASRTKPRTGGAGVHAIGLPASLHGVSGVRGRLGMFVVASLFSATVTTSWVTAGIAVVLVLQPQQGRRGLVDHLLCLLPRFTAPCGGSLLGSLARTT